MSTRADAVDLTELEEDGETQEQQEQPDAVPAPESTRRGVVAMLWRLPGRADSVPGEVDASSEAGIFTPKVVLFPVVTSM